MPDIFLPSTLPLVPLPPPQLLYPHLQATLQIPSSHLAVLLNAIAENATRHKLDSSRIIAIVPVVEIERRVGRWATAARIKSVTKVASPPDTFNIILEGIARIRLPRSLPPVLSILPPLPLPISTYSLPVSDLHILENVDLVPLATALLPPQLHEKINLIPPTLLADLLVSVLQIDWDVRAELLGVPDVQERCAKVYTILSKLVSDRGLAPATTTKPLLTSTPATIPRSRALIRRPLGPPTMGLPEDLQPLDSLFQRRLNEISSSAGQAITRELKRLSKIPPQSAEYGVGKTYIEWLLSLPWKKVTETPHDLDLAKARSILDDEHEGLEKVKRRVVEYLAVYQLKRKLFEEETAAKLQEKKTTKTTHQAVQNAAFDASTAGELLELIPKDERKALEETQTPMDDILTKDVYRDKGPILLLVGPPGVGKTSIARSLATSLGRKFHRISLGGVRDEAEIRGHRRTYIGALPGLLVQGLRKVGVANPVILLDELDKVGTSNFHGDPSAALLEALDPAQNWSFHDHYLGDVPIDLSQCMFIATANTLDTISPPLLDRCETITCSGYVTSEKLAIAKRFLLPKQVKENGLLAVGVQMGDGVIEKVITEFTFEAGVRSLEREISRICRTKAVEYSTARQSTHSPYNPEVTSNDVDTILGVAHFDPDVREETHRPGVVTGLAWQASGTGGIMLIETTLVPGGNGQLVLTGSLGGVISESAQLGLTWVKSHSASLGILLGDTDPYKSHDIHLHLPAGSVKKDGPSAGIGMVLAIASLLTGRVVPSTTAVTGEITLRGAVTPVGGIKEKVLGAHRAGIRKIILPKKNLREVMADLPESVKDEMDFVFVGTIEEALEEVWGKDIWTDTSRPRLEAKL